jgi:3-hydroxyacyl-CoA dehydrogenase/enoyl-CoA hydratase/3-hydroxybutyryl-CoA epimerase/3-hydroxyacyl-CoA dehydrogenase/enoyl-CoA hydratase/3-hydroxybutyryl-CoA epimerase/enoyl-CoA isomerase
MPCDGTPTWSLFQPDIALLEFSPIDMFRGHATSVALGLAQTLDELRAERDLTGLILVPPIQQDGNVPEAYVPPLAQDPTRSREQLASDLRTAHEILARLGQCPFVTAAAIDGACLGWAAELACWCDVRVVTDCATTRIQFPDLELGLIPSWGGTVRIPQLVGLADAVDLIVTGVSCGSERLLEIGLVDANAARDKLLEMAVRLIRSLDADGRYQSVRRQRARRLSAGDAEVGSVATAGARTGVAEPASDCVASLARQLLIASAGSKTEQADRQELEAAIGLIGSPAHEGLCNVVLLQQHNEQDVGAETVASVQPVRSVGIIGAGTMGAGIAAENLRARIPAVISDASPAALSRGICAAKQQVADIFENEQTEIVAGLLTAAERENAVADCDLVIETVVENLEVKRRIYDRLEPRLSAHATLTSNTSTLPIKHLAERLSRPDRFCGLHFFTPVRDRKLVEVVRGPASSEGAVARVVAYAKRLGKMPIVVNDGPGFLVNRLLCAYLNEAHELLCQGVPMDAIDRAAESFGMRLGPIQVYDLIGVDTIYYAARSMWDVFSDRIGLLPLVPAMVKNNRLGRKTGRGFHRYETPDGPPLPDPEMPAFIERYVRRKLEVDQDTIKSRLFLAILLEATRVLESGVVEDPRDVDTGVVFSLGFPRARGGILFWADTLGAQRILEVVAQLQPLGPRFQPTSLLVEMADRGSRFYEIQRNTA